MSCDPNLEVVAGELQSQCKYGAEGVFGISQRPWMNFSSLKKVGKFEFEQLHTLFNRDKGNADYVKLRQEKEAVAGDLQTAKLSVELLSSMERDYRQRQRSRVRNFVHAGQRYAVKGEDRGPIRQYYIDWVNALQKESLKEGEK